MIHRLLLGVAALLLVDGALGLSVKTNQPRRLTAIFGRSSPGEEPDSASHLSRREVCRVVAGGTVLSSAFLVDNEASAEDGYRPAKRPTAYRVDSTQPPTLIPLSSARHEAQILRELGSGSGTDKEAIVDDRVNLNNMLNKAVFGSINAVSGVVGGKRDETKSGPGYASFVCMGVPAATSPIDIDLAVGLLKPIVENHKGDTALGLSFCPISAQSDLDSYSDSGDESALQSALLEKGVPKETVDMYLPLFRISKLKSLKLLAVAPERDDILTARTRGLQNVDPERRKLYVVDAEGFIGLSQDPRFKLYTDRSLLKDFSPLKGDDQPGGFFAERILVHETAATVAAKYASQRPDSLVAIVAPAPDVRFLLGINGRIPRICNFLNPGQNKVTANAVTTILLNPTAKETLSKSRYLRLEIGTGPQTLDYQTKVADYLWFSSSPKVNMIPRLMNG